MTDSVHIKFQALVEKLKAAWNRLPEEYRYPEILEVIDAVSDLPCECTDRTKMELDAVRAVEGYSSPPNIVVPEAESGSTPLRTLLRRVHEWNDSDELDAIPVMADVEETLIHVLEKAALPESGPAGAKLREQIGSYVDGMCASPVIDTRRIARQLISFLNAYDAAALLVPAAPQEKHDEEKDLSRLPGVPGYEHEDPREFRNEVK